MRREDGFLVSSKVKEVWMGHSESIISEETAVKANASSIGMEAGGKQMTVLRESYREKVKNNSWTEV